MFFWNSFKVFSVVRNATEQLKSAIELKNSLLAALKKCDSLNLGLNEDRKKDGSKDTPTTSAALQEDSQETASSSNALPKNNLKKKSNTATNQVSEFYLNNK